MSSYYSIYPRTLTWQAIKQEQKYRQEAETLREEVESLKARGSCRRKPCDFLILYMFVHTSLYSVNMIRNTYVKTILNFIHFITHTNTIHIQFISIAHLGLSSCRFYCMLGCFPSGKGKLVGREEGLWTASETKVGKGFDLLKQNCLETLEATSRASEAFWRAGTAGSQEVTGQHLATASEELGWLVELSALISASFLSS